MDFMAMKRKDLQALCKQHGIKANLKNSEMVEKLSALLLKEEDQKADEELEEATAVKRVKFSPDNETFYFVATDKDESDSDCKYSPKTRKPGGRRNPSRVNKKEEVVEVIEIKDTPVRVTRSRKQQNMVRDVGNVDERGVKRVKVQDECDNAIVLRKGKIVVRERRSQRRTTLVSGIAEVVETGKLGREVVNAKGAAKRGRVSTRNVGKKVLAETGNDMAATVVEVDEVMKENQDPSLLKGSSLVVQEDVIKPKRRSRRCTNKTALTELSVPAGKNSPLEEPKIDVGIEAQEPAGNGDKTDSSLKIKVVENSRKKRKGSSKKSESTSKDQLVSSAVSTAYLDLGKSTDISTCPNENQPEESVNIQAATIVHTEQNVVQPVIGLSGSVSVENTNGVLYTNVEQEQEQELSTPAEHNSPLEEPKVDVGTEVQKPAGSGNKTDSCLKNVGENLKMKNTSSKKRQSATKDQTVNFAVSSAYLDLGKSMDNSAYLNENQPVESVNLQATTLFHTEQNAVELVINQSVAVENDLHIAAAPGVMKVINEYIMDDEVVQQKLICSNSDGWMDPQRMLGDVSHEMVDEVQDIGIHESMEEANTVHSKETEGVNHVPNIDTLATCDPSESSMPKPETGVEIPTNLPVTASDPEHKALKSEAASPIMNNSETDRVFGDGLISGLKKSGPEISKGNLMGKLIEDLRECDDTFEENPAVSPCKTFYLKDLYAESKTEDSVFVKSISGNGAVPDDQLPSGVIDGVVEDPKLIDQIVTADVEVDSEMPTADAAEAVGENQLDTAVLSDATLTQFDSSPAVQVNGDAQSLSSYGVSFSREGKDSEMMNLHMSVGENAKMDGSGVLECLSGEKVDESLDTGICGSDEEIFILNSKQNDEILDLYNIGSLFTCSADSTKPSMLTPGLGDVSPVTASNHGKSSLYEEKEAVECKDVSPILNSFGVKELFTDDQTSGFKKSDLEMCISDSTRKFTEGMENTEEQTDNLQDVITELLHQEHDVMGQVVEPKVTQEMSNQCQTGSAVIITNTCIPTIWDDPELKPCNDDTDAQKCSGDLCGLKWFNKAGGENAKEPEPANTCLVSQRADDVRISEGLEACTASCTVNQIADENSLLTFGYVRPSTVSPEVVKSLETNMSVEVAGFEVSNPSSNEAASSKDFNLNDESKCDLSNVPVYGSEEHNAVTDILSTAITEADSGIKNATNGVKSVEKPPQRLDGDSLPGERNSSYMKSFSDISRIRTEFDSPLTLQDVSLSCGLFDKRRLPVQEGFDSIGLKFKYAIEDGIGGTPVAATRQEINTSENAALPLVDSLGMEWLFGEEAHNLDPEMSNGSLNSKDVKKGNVSEASPQIGSEELSEHKHQAAEVEKLNSSQELASPLVDSLGMEWLFGEEAHNLDPEMSNGSSNSKVVKKGNVSEASPQIGSEELSEHKHQAAEVEKLNSSQELEINTSENVASPLVDSLGMEWLFEEAHNLDPEMSKFTTSSKDVEKVNAGVASPQVSSGEVGEHKQQAIAVGKLNFTEELELDSIKGRSLEADAKKSTGIYITPLLKKNQPDVLIPRTPNNLVGMSNMKENFNARKSELVKNITSAPPLHNRRALEDLQNK